MRLQELLKDTRVVLGRSCSTTGEQGRQVVWLAGPIALHMCRTLQTRVEEKDLMVAYIHTFCVLCWQNQTLNSMQTHLTLAMHDS